MGISCVVYPLKTGCARKSCLEWLNKYKSSSIHPVTFKQGVARDNLDYTTMIWGMTLHPGEEFTRKVVCDEHLTLASLECRADKSVDGGRPSSCLLFKTGRGQHVLCTLEEGVMNQQCLDLILEQGEKITFLVEGTGTVYLTGYASRKRQREMCWPIRDTEGSNTGFDDSFQGETDMVFEKDLRDDGDHMMHKVSGSHGDYEGNHSDIDGNHGDKDSDHIDNNGYHSDNNDDSGDDGVHGENDNYSSDGGDDRGDEKDDNRHSGSDNIVVEGSVDTIVEGNAEPGNRDHEENDPRGLNTDEQNRAIVLPLKIKEEPCSENVSVSSESNRSNNSLQSRSQRITRSHPEGGNRSSTKTHAHRCYICLESFLQKVDCVAHENICHKGTLWKNRDKEPHRCKLCGKAFDKPSEKRNHELTHMEEKHYGCRYCVKKFKTMYSARRHENIHTQRGHVCQFCPKTYASKSHLEEHMRSHTGEKPFDCPKCPTFFRTLSARNRHLRSHETINRYQCQKCGKGLSSEKKLAKHDKIHTALPKFLCRYCDMAFVRHYHRLRHEKMTHLS